MRGALLILMLMIACVGRAAPTTTGLALAIGVAGWGANGGYFEGQPISIRCVVENCGKAPREVLLKDHDPYHGTLPYPTTLTATLLDSEGRPLIEHWSQYVAWSTIFAEMPGDRITLKPGESVVRVVPLDEVLRASPIKVVAGSYRVRLRLGDLESNELAVIVKKPNKPAPAQRP
jgi:hypothetical protein